MHQVSNLVLDLFPMFGHSANELESKPYDSAQDRYKQVEMLDRFFLSRLNFQSAQRLISSWLGQITRSHGTTSILDLSHQVGYSIRTLDRLFRQHVGFSPKWYARVIRLHHALELLIHDDVMDLASVAFQIGYYDEAHFNRNCKAFTGRTPSEYRRQLKLRRTQPPPNLPIFTRRTTQHLVKSSAKRSMQGEQYV
jgi:transcriptional regulator GlxA family with amidase domain